MSTRYTDIDQAELTLNKRHEIHFDELISKEKQLNHALADLLSISNNIESPEQKTNNISASIDLLNNLLQTFDLHDEQTKLTHQNTPIKSVNMFSLMLSDNICANCHQSFATNEQIVNAAGQIWHMQCFVCTQCFQTFENGIYFEHENRKYCEKDFQMLFSPCCANCKKAIVGRVIRAVEKCFHPHCFRCQLCRISLIEQGFFKINNKVFCRDCHAKEKTKELQFSQHICSKCQTEIDLPICTACHCFINERIIYALGKSWHVEHFTCAHCARPFNGNKYYEYQGLAYCETDYHNLFGSICFICNHDNSKKFTIGKKNFQQTSV